MGKKTLKVQGFLEEFEIEDIKKRVDIIDLLDSFGVKMKKTGGSTGSPTARYMGLCPFHEDHNPSLSVDREKGLFNCFGCGESGTVVDVVMKLKNVGFRESMDYLKGFKAVYIPPKEIKPETHSLTPAAGEEENGGGLDLTALQKHYHDKLYSNPSALEYLKKRGFKSSQLYEKFQIGYSDGSLLSKLGEKQREELKRIGILNDPSTGSGTAIQKEHFLNCLVFPILDDTGNVISYYGRSIKDDSTVGERSRTIKHRYLKGNHKGVFNRKVSKVYDEVILTESIIDALSLIEAGLENVQAIYGTNGFTEEHLEILKADRVKIVVLALDNDESGQKASEKLKERLLSEGFKVKIVFPYGRLPSGVEVKDWNECLVAGNLNKKDLKTLIEQAAVFSGPSGTIA